MSEIEVRISKDDDVHLIVSLLSERGNPHCWTKEKWLHNYIDYPNGEAVSFIALIDGEVVGHYGIQKVKIKNDNVYLGLHAYVKSSMRGVVVISKLLLAVDDYSKSNSVDYLIGFANKKFTIIKTTLFKWNCVLWLSFQKRTTYKINELDIKRFRIESNKDWLSWRFNNYKDFYLSKYKNSRCLQLLKLSTDYYGDEVECWHPSENLGEEDGELFSQPFSVKVFNKNLIHEGILEPSNWGIEMGDSDTFIYNEIK
jgi:hypothetical protein